MFPLCYKRSKSICQEMKHDVPRRAIGPPLQSCRWYGGFVVWRWTHATYCWRSSHNLNSATINLLECWDLLKAAGRGARSVTPAVRLADCGVVFVTMLLSALHCPLNALRGAPAPSQLLLVQLVEEEGSYWLDSQLLTNRNKAVHFPNLMREFLLTRFH